MEVSSELNISATLSQGKDFPYQLYRRLEGPESQPRCCDEEKNLCSCQKSNPNPTAVPIELSQLKIGVFLNYI
jgi:hypothetical protein